MNRIERARRRKIFCLALVLSLTNITGCRFYENESGGNSSARNSVNRANANAAPEELPADVAEKIPIVQLEPQKAAALKKAVTRLLEAWKTSIEKRSVEKYLSCYADRLETFYLQHDVEKTFAGEEFGRAFGKYDSIRLDLTNLDIRPTAEDEAFIIFDKTWEFKNHSRVSTGSLQQIVGMRKINRRWFIVSERDWRVYSNQNQELSLEDNANK